LIVALVCDDLLTSSRIEAICSQSGGFLHLVASPTGIRVDDDDPLLVLVDCQRRSPEWVAQISDLRRRVPAGSRLIAFGPHRDLRAHADAIRAGIGPMWARSKLFADLPSLLSTP